MNEKNRETITRLTEELLTKLTVSGSVALEEKDGALHVKIETQEPAVLIGYHGRSLESIQILLGQMVYETLGEWVRLVVTVGDYRERREEQLKDLAFSAAQKVISTGDPESFSDLTPAERRTIHLVLADHPDVVSESEGEGRDRKLVIKLKNR